VSDNFNWIKALTAGFEEPWAASLLAGNVANFYVPDSADIKGMVTAGTWSAQAIITSRTMT
jgi:hypothetical protein